MRGDQKGIIQQSDEAHPSMTAFVWMDHDYWYFITNTSGLMEGQLSPQLHVMKAFKFSQMFCVPVLLSCSLLFCTNFQDCNVVLFVVYMQSKPLLYTKYLTEFSQ